MEDFVVLFEFWKAGDTTEEEVKEAFNDAVNKIEEAEFKSTLNEPEDELPAMLQINSGAGGTESQDWAEMLARMFRMYGEKQGWGVTEMDWQWGDGAGIKTCTYKFEGAFAYGFLKSESGVHRLVRISPFDSNARRHTSFVSVNVYPLVDDTINIEINPADVKNGNQPKWWCRRTKRKQSRNQSAINAYSYRHCGSLSARQEPARQPGVSHANAEEPFVRNRIAKTQRNKRCCQ